MRFFPYSPPIVSTKPYVLSISLFSFCHYDKTEYRHYGLELVEGKVRDNLSCGVVEPAISKIKSLRFATEAAITILRIGECCLCMQGGKGGVKGGRKDGRKNRRKEGGKEGQKEGKKEGGPFFSEGGGRWLIVWYVKRMVW